MAKKSKEVSLVTGACGFIGSHIVETLAAAGHEVIAADMEAAWKTDSVPQARYPSLIRKLAARCETIDLARPETLKVLPAEVDYVFHVASLFSYSATWDALYRVNVEGARALLARYSRSPRLKRWLQIGAGGVYGLPSERQNRTFTEDMAPNPTNDYLRSKWEQEFTIMEAGKRGEIKWTIVRPTTVYGPRGGYGSRKLLLGMDGMAVVAAPGNFRGHIPFIHVEDLAQACLYLAQHPEAENQVFNLSDDTDMTNLEYMETMARLLQRPFVKLPPVPAKKLIDGLMPLLKFQHRFCRDVLKKQSPIEPDMIAYFPEDFRYSNEKLKKTGFTFRYPDARMAFPSTLQWYRDNG